MEIGKIFLVIALAFAVVAGIADVPHAAAVTAVLGLLFLACVIALATAYSAPMPIPALGPALAGVLGSVSALLNAAACTFVLLTAVRMLRPGGRQE